MASVSSYKTKKTKTKKSQTLYKFQAYTAPDEYGKKHKVTRQGFKSQKEAEFAGEEYEAEQRHHGYADPKQITFREAFQHFLDTEGSTKRGSTYNTYLTNYKPILAEIGDQKLHEVTSKQCQALVDRWFRDNVPRYNKRKQQTSRIFNHAIKMGWLDFNPWNRVTVPTNPEKPVSASTMLDNYYTAEELHIFLNAVKRYSHPEHYMVFELQAYSAMRVGEILALTWADLDFDNATVTITKTVTKTKKTNRPVLGPPKNEPSRRTVTIDPVRLDLLRDWQKQHGDRELLFPGVRSGKLMYPNVPDTWMTQAVTHYNNDPENKEHPLRRITTHGFRHSFVTLAHEAGFKELEVAKQLGHGSVDTQRKYYMAVTAKAKKQTALDFAKYVDQKK